MRKRWMNGLALFCMIIGLTTRGESAMVQASDAPLRRETAAWDALVKAHVRADGGTDYVELAKKRPELEAFVQSYRQIDLKGADENTKKALYINLYNAGMMLNLLRHAAAVGIAVNSPAFTALEINKLKIPGGNIWNGDYTFDLSGHSVTLDDIEHGLLRGQAKGPFASLKVSRLDPRIHAAVNCAALSCPPVRTEAYTPETVETMLETNMQRFLSNNDQFTKRSESKLTANAIVFWYYEDFDAQGGAGKYLARFIQDGTLDRDWKMKFLQENFNDRSKIMLKLSKGFDFAYDWRVNDVRNKR